MVDWDQTRDFPAFCNAILLAEQGDQIAQTSIADHTAAANDQLEAMLRESSRVANAILAMKRDTDSELLRARIRRRPMPSEAGIRLLHEMYNMATYLFRDDPSVPKIHSTPIKAKDHFLFRSAIAMRLLALWWAENGGIENVRAEALRNDMIDVTYVVCATYWDGLLTKDKKMRAIYEECSHIIRMMSGPSDE
jgi:hypothetical protein